jgi:hypothetical protein
MGRLAQRVTVDQTPFDFLPPRLGSAIGDNDVYDSDPSAGCIEEVYAFCHHWVFQRKAPGKVGLHTKAVLNRVRESGTSIKLFFLANMLGWKESRPTDKFRANVLTGDFAVRQVKTFASVCRERYGTFDTVALDNLTGSNIADEDFEHLLHKSEMEVGTWVIGYRLLKSGNVAANLYKEKELDLDPYWLALEPSYFDLVLRDHLADPAAASGGCPVLREHRHRAVHILGRLKHSARSAVTVFRTKERVMPDVIKRVLALRGLRSIDFMVEQTPQRQTIRFWEYLARAIQQFECLKFVDKSNSMFDRLLNE